MILRKAVFDDWALLLSWRNDSGTRNHSINNQAISEQEHKQWLKKTLDNAHRQLFIVVSDNHPVGTVRADFDPLLDVYELSWTVAPDMRGKGIGKHMVKLLADRIPGKLMARIKKENISSVKIAVFAGLHFQKEENGVLFYGKE